MSNDTMTLLQEHVRETEGHMSIMQDHVNNDDTL